MGNNTQAETSTVYMGGVGSSVEPVKQVSLCFCRDAYTIVDDADLNFILMAVAGEVDILGVGGELYSVGQQV